MELWRLFEFIVEGLLGSAAVLVLPALIVLVAREIEKVERKREQRYGETYGVLRNHILDRLRERL